MFVPAQTDPAQRDMLLTIYSLLDSFYLYMRSEPDYTVGLRRLPIGMVRMADL